MIDDAAQRINGPAVEEDFGGCTTGTEERLELLEAGTESTTTSTATATETSTTLDPEN